MVQPSATWCSCIAILCQSSEFYRLTLCIASQRVFIFVSLYFVINSVRNLLDTLSFKHNPTDCGIETKTNLNYVGLFSQTFNFFKYCKGCTWERTIEFKLTIGEMKKMLKGAQLISLYNQYMGTA
jgi:hypothetical protein